MDYQVNEIFSTVQGEGFLVGSPATFIRLQGCTVGCPWCDTKYTWKAGGTRMSTLEILTEVFDVGPNRHVVITGGEPTMYNLDDLMRELRKTDHYIQLETSGQQWLKGHLRPDWITWSPKESLNWDAPKQYYKQAKEVKWVVDDNLSLELVMYRWSQIFEARVSKRGATAMPYTAMPYFVLMPEGCPPTPEHVTKALIWLKEIPPRLGEKWRYGDRIQYRIGVR